MKIVSAGLLCAAVALGTVQAQPTKPGRVSAGGIVLRSTTTTLPEDDAGYPAGPHVDAMNQNCAACHSASMVLSQPRLSADQWKAEVAKMRETYKAPLDDADVPAILAYLEGVSAAKAR
ncbi:MAG TPA: cytochrome c [Sphingomonas sp.]|jgi:mono/diheme cytochrome c family protein|nr:cytochrome c [Sphingomonas sp.]